MDGTPGALGGRGSAMTEINCTWRTLALLELNRKKFKMESTRTRPLANLLLLGATLSGVTGQSLGAEPPSMDRLAMENADLRKRLETLESIAQKEGILASGQAPAMSPVKALSNLTISGFVQASYFYNTREPADRKSDGYLWNTSHNSFSLNKFKLTLASPPPERSGETWGAGYRTSMIWGEDAPVLNTGSPYAGFEALREAYVEVNAPVGTGLNIKFGQLISLLNWESGDGGAANPNFSQGYQWFFTGNGPSTGAQVGYTFTEWLDVKVRVQNGMYAGPIDGNSGKTAMGSVGLKPTKDLWINLIGFGGDESATLAVKGGSVLAGYNFTSDWHAGMEFDYFNFDSKPGASADLWSIGGWLWYDFTANLSGAFRAEFLDDPDGGGLKGIGLRGRPGSAIFSTDPDGSLASLTFTLTWKPTPNLKVQPEIRYDHTGYKGGLDGEKDRFTIGAGVSYLF